LCKSLDSYSTKQAVIFSSFMKNHKTKIPKTFIELFFYGSWISWAWTHDMSLDSYLWRLIKIFLWGFIELTPVIINVIEISITNRVKTRQCFVFRETTKHKNLPQPVGWDMLSLSVMYCLNDHKLCIRGQKVKKKLLSLSLHPKSTRLESEYLPLPWRLNLINVFFLTAKKSYGTFPTLFQLQHFPK